MDLAREDMERVGAKEGDEVDREKWKILSRCGDPEQGEAERRRRSLANKEHTQPGCLEKRIRNLWSRILGNISHPI